MDKSGTRLVGTGDLTDDNELPGMTDATLGIITAHHSSALHDSPLNRTFVESFQAAYGKRPNYHSVAGYDGMHLIYEALKKTRGNVDGNALLLPSPSNFLSSPRDKKDLILTRDGAPSNFGENYNARTMVDCYPP